MDSWCISNDSTLYMSLLLPDLGTERSSEPHVHPIHSIFELCKTFPDSSLYHSNYGAMDTK